jgi:hypothetical protein
MVCSRLKFTIKKILTMVEMDSLYVTKVYSTKKLSYSGFFSGVSSLWKVPSYLIHVHKIFDQEYRTRIILLKNEPI